MVASRDEILNAALELSEPDRLEIANRLLDTLPEDAPGLSLTDSNLTEELDRRSGNWEGAVGWTELRSQLEQPK